MIVMRPRFENTYDVCSSRSVCTRFAASRDALAQHDGNIRFVVYNLERAILSMPPGVEKWVVIVDYNVGTVAVEGASPTAERVVCLQGYSMRNAPPMKTRLVPRLGLVVGGSFGN